MKLDKIKEILSNTFEIITTFIGVSIAVVILIPMMIAFIEWLIKVIWIL